eukprot:2135119-Rhodomonas_salina.1
MREHAGSEGVQEQGSLLLFATQRSDAVLPPVLSIIWSTSSKSDTNLACEVMRRVLKHLPGGRVEVKADENCVEGRVRVSGMEGG